MHDMLDCWTHGWTNKERYHALDCWTNKENYHACNSQTAGQTKKTIMHDISLTAGQMKAPRVLMPRWRHYVREETLGFFAGSTVRLLWSHCISAWCPTKLDPKGVLYEEECQGQKVIN